MRANAAAGGGEPGRAWIDDRGDRVAVDTAVNRISLAIFSHRFPVGRLPARWQQQRRRRRRSSWTAVDR